MKILQDIGWKATAGLAPTIAWVLLAPLIIRTLGADQFGLFALIFGAVALLNVMTVGFIPALTRESVPLILNKDFLGLGEAVSRTALFLFAIGALAAIVMGSLALFGSEIFDLGPGTEGLFRHSALMAAAYLFLSFPLSPAHSLMDALHAFRTDALIRTGQSATFLLGSALALVHGLPLTVVLAAYFSTSLTASLSRALFIRSKLPQLRLKYQIEWASRTRQSIRDTIVMGLWSISGSIVHNTDKVLVAVFAPIHIVGMYDLGARINDASRLAIFGGLPAILPHAAASDFPSLREAHMLVSKILLATVTAIVLWLLAFGDALVLLWVGPGFEQTITIGIILMLSTLYQSQHVSGHFFLAGMGILKPLRNASVVAPVLNLTLSVVLGLSYGAVGIAAATLLTILATESYLVQCIRKSLRITIRTYLESVHVRVIAASIIALVPWSISSHLNLWVAPADWPGMILATASAGFLTILLIAFVVLDTNERRQLRRTFSKPPLFPEELPQQQT